MLLWVLLLVVLFLSLVLSLSLALSLSLSLWLSLSLSLSLVGVAVVGPFAVEFVTGRVLWAASGIFGLPWTPLDVAALGALVGFGGGLGVFWAGFEGLGGP